MIGNALSLWKYISGVLSPRLSIPVDGARLNNQPTGAEDLAISTTKYVDDNDFWIRTGTLLNPEVSTDDVEWDAFKYVDATTGGTTNIFVGDGSGGTSNTGARNVALGYLVLGSLTSGSQNFGSGANALGSLTTGSNNVAIGRSAGLSLTSGGNNMLIGQNAGVSLASGLYNTFIGDSSGRYSTSSSNLGIGFAACQRLTNSGNVGIGVTALQNMTNSSGNVALGFGAMTGGVGSTSDNNIGVGRNSGFSLTTGDANVMIGYESGYGLTTESNKLIIENSNDIVTPLVYGEFDNKVIKINGGFGAAYIAKTATYTATRADYTIDCTANTFTVTLPTAVGYTGQMYNIKNTGTGAITIATTSSQTIDGATTQTISKQYTNVPVQSNGSNWIIL